MWTINLKVEAAFQRHEVEIHITQSQYCNHAWLGSNKGLINFQARRKRLTRHPDAPAVIVRAALGGNVRINSVYQMDS